MKQIIRYLYEYEDGVRIRNIGFIKMEKQMDKCNIHIHGKGVDFGPEKKLEVYVIFLKNGQCVGVPQGTLEEMAPVIDCVLKFDWEDMGGHEEFDRASGLVICNSAGRKYGAVWTDEPVNIENMQEHYEEEEEEKAPVHETLVEHVEKLVEKQEVEILEECEEEEEKEEVEEYIPPKITSYEKIQRQDISRLPRKEWKLANNSFLLHGFYTYHHLLLIEENGSRWLGVPGIYHEKEKAAARAFGFPQFHRITDSDVELTREEKNTYDDFGYWCRQVENLL